MTKKMLIVIALVLAALCVIPALAESSPGVWSNGNFYTNEQWAKMSDGSSVVYSPYSDVTSKYRDTNPAKSTEVFVGANTCTLEGNVRAGYNTLTKEVLLANVLAPNETKAIPVQPDGRIGVEYDGTPVVLAQGKYILKIVPQFEGLGPEQVSSATCDHGVARPESELLGFAVSASPAKAITKVIPENDITICKAVYSPNEWKCTEKMCKDKHGKDTCCFPGSADVTSVVQGLLDGFVNPFEVSNEVLGTDPALGWKKKLDVVYVDENGSCKKPCTWKYKTANEWASYPTTHGVMSIP